MSLHRQLWLRLAALGLLLLAALVARADTATTPGYMGFLTDVASVRYIEAEDWAELQFPPSPWGDNGVGRMARGKHWTIYVLAYGNNLDIRGTWAQLDSGFESYGWKVVRQFDGNPMVITLHLDRGGIDAWANVDIGEAPKARIQLVEVGPPPLALTLKAPAAKAEAVDPADGDFPYLSPLLGATLEDSHHDDNPFNVQMTDSGQYELVANGSITKNYKAPVGTSAMEFMAVYHQALLDAGWSLVSEGSTADATIVAHYGHGGRNLWANLHYRGDAFSFRVGDEPNKGIAAIVGKHCHAPITGVLFDAGAPTLKPESDAALEPVRALLAKSPGLHLEVQDHSDNLGNENASKTLSTARAKSVMTWLIWHGIAPERLTAKGYGDSQPIEDNSTDTGRARNRRVEIMNPACKPPKEDEE